MWTRIGLLSTTMQDGRGMRYVAVSEEKVQTAGVTLMLVYFC
jgi:hypothetical protein